MLVTTTYKLADSYGFPGICACSSLMIIGFREHSIDQVVQGGDLIVDPVLMCLRHSV